MTFEIYRRKKQKETIGHENTHLRGKTLIKLTPDSFSAGIRSIRRTKE